MGEVEDSTTPDTIPGALGRNQTLDSNDYLKIIHIDVSQGESTLVIYGSRQIKYAALIDGGHAQYFKAIVATLEAYEVKELDLILTHSDSDHIEGLTALLNARKQGKAGVKINNVYHRGADSSEQKDRLFFNAIKESPATDRVAKTGTRFYPPADGGATAAAASASASPAQSSRTHHARERFVFECLFATDQESMRDNNHCSIMMKLGFGAFSYYTGGDQISENEEGVFCPSEKNEVALIDVAPRNITAFKCSHHGSNKSTSEKFLMAIEPEVAFISAGSASFCHPDYPVLQRLERCRTIKAVYLTNCFYNRPQVNPDYVAAEVKLEKEYLSRIGNSTQCPAKVKAALTFFLEQKTPDRAHMLLVLQRLLPASADVNDENDEDMEPEVEEALPGIAAAAFSSSSSQSGVRAFRRDVKAAATAMRIFVEYKAKQAADSARKMHVAGSKEYLGNIELHVRNDASYLVGFCADTSWRVHDSTGEPVTKISLPTRRIGRAGTHPFDRFVQLTAKGGAERTAVTPDNRSNVNVGQTVAAHERAKAASERLAKFSKQRRERKAKEHDEAAAAARKLPQDDDDDDDDADASMTEDASE